MSYLFVCRMRNLFSKFPQSIMSPHSCEHRFILRPQLFQPHPRVIQPHRSLSLCLRNNALDCLWTKEQPLLSRSCRTGKLFSTASQSTTENEDEEEDEEDDDDDDEEEESDDDDDDDDDEETYFSFLPLFMQDPKDSYLFAVPMGLALLWSCWYWNEKQAIAPEIDFPTLLTHLERGEIREVYVGNSKAFVRYQSTMRKPLEMVRMSGSVLRSTIRLKETNWGITPENSVPIINRIPFELSLENPKHTKIPVQLCYRLGQLVSVLLILFGILPIIRFLVTVVEAFDEEDEIEQNTSQMRFSTDFRTTNLTPDYRPVKTKVRFADVAGMHECKEEVMEYVTIMKEPERFQRLGAKLPKGALLLGPSGTGKTLLVKALANESGVPCYTVAGSEIIQVFAGVGAARIRKLFANARENAPSIVFIDELDSVGMSRFPSADDDSPGSHSYHYPPGVCTDQAQTLNQLLIEMDGINSTENVLVFAATNRPDTLDPALLRPGRFDRHIYVDLPNLAERKEILALYIGKSRLSPSIEPSQLIEHLSNSTALMSGADLFGICNEAALSAIRRDSQAKYVTWEDFEAALERVVAGRAKQSNPLSPAERRMAAVQQAGRTLAAWLLPRAGLVPVKVSIVPRVVTPTNEHFGDLGFTQFTPEDLWDYTSQQLEDRMAVLLGGRAAEQILYNAVSDASERCLGDASEMALQQVREYGMSKVVGNISFEEDGRALRPYSDHTQQLIEMEAHRLVFSAYNRCVNLLTNHKQQLEALIAALVEKETLGTEELTRILKENVARTTSPM